MAVTGPVGPGPLAVCLAAVLGGPAARAEDVVVVGATPAGICAAVAAAQGGASVALVEESAHVGGIVSGGLTMNDIRDKRAVKGLFEEFRRRVRQHYVDTSGADSQQVKDSRDGHHYEPHVAERVFAAMLVAEKAVRLLTRHRLRAVHRDGTKVRRAVFDVLGAPGKTLELDARVFVDATYEGDLAALAGAAYRVGRESRGEYGEPQAGRIFAKFGSAERLAGSTGEGDRGVNPFCFRFHVTAAEANRVPFRKPAAYARDDYRHLAADFKTGKVGRLRQVMQLWPAPNGKFQTNSEHPDPGTGVPSESFDLAEENWDWPEAGPARRKAIFDRYWAYSEGLFWFLQNDADVPEAVRREARTFGLCKDEFADHDHRPWCLYVREGRRCVGEYTFTQRDADPGRERRRADSIAVVEYPFDSHGVHKYDPVHPGVREGYFFIEHPPLPLPYGVIVPQKVDGLLVPVALSASRVGYQAVRMEPVFMATGEAAGVAAALSLKRTCEVRAVPPEVLRAELLRRGAVLELDPLPPAGK